MARVESFVFYTSWLESIEELDDEKDKLESLLAIMHYQAYHEEPNKSGVPKAMFTMAKPVADELYNRRMANVENGKKGGRPTKVAQSEETEDKANGNQNTTQVKPMKTQVKPNANLYDNENENGNENDNDKRVNKRFAKPSVDEIKSYCQERKNGIDADRFFNYYESNGWKVGKNPMKDWKAAVRTWEQNTPKPQIEERKVLETW